MTKTWLAATAAFAMMTGIALAQSSSSTTTSTQSTTAAPVSAFGSSSAVNTQQITSSDGVVTDKTQTYSSGTTLTPAGDVATTRKTSETTTTR